MANLSHASINISNLEQLAAQKSVIHKIHPMSKLVSAIVYIVVVISFSYKNITGLAPYIFYPVIIMSLANIPYKPLLRRLIFALPFSFMAGISNIIFTQNSDGVISFAAIMLKTFLTVFAALILIATTPFTEITRQLNKLRVPKILCLLLVMTYRYLSVLLSEAFTMRTAYILRSRNQKGIRLKDFGIFLGQLVLKSFDRAERVYDSMKCRGFDGIYHGEYTYTKIKIFDIVYTAFIVGLTMFLRFFNLSLFLGGILG